MTQPDGPNRGALSLVGTQRTVLDHATVACDPEATLVSHDSHPLPVIAPELLNATLSSGALAALGQRYDVLGEAGHGSMGSVYKARDRETGEVVALKLLKPEIASDQKMVERFKNELLYARKITHKNVCRVYDFNRAGSVAYTSMEYVEGESLRSVLNRFGGLPQRKAIHVALQICSGLKEAHAQGIIHRDLKPENIMMDTQGNVKIMDFGIARSMEAGTNLTGSMLGTPAYMSPEQVSGKSVDARTDIYALGLILYEMFTGSQAFRADTAMAVALKQIQETPLPPHEVEPSVPVPIERAILKCIEKDPAKRFQSMEDLERALTGASRPAGTSVTPMSAPMKPAPTVAYAQRPAVEKSGSRAMWVVLWIALGAVTVLAAGAGARWMALAKAMANLQLPQTAAAPKPPDFAFATTHSTPSSTPPPSATIKKAVASSETDIPVIDKPKDTGAVESPAPASSAKPQPSQPTGQPAGSASLASQPAAPPPVTSQPPANNAPVETTATTFLWVGRFIKEDRAQNTMKRLEDLKLPAMIVPRDGPTGKFYIVLTGPFTQSKAPQVKQNLEAQGFENIHRFDLPPANPKPETHP